MSLASLQSAFLAGLAAPGESDCAELPQSASGGFAIYRNAYRSTLIETLRDTFPRTLDYVGEAPFRATAAHHFIAHPPSSWSLDHAGRGFAATLHRVFANNAEVSEIARLEWAMHEVFVAPDHEPLDSFQFAQATVGFGDDDWSDMKLAFGSLIVVPCTFDLLGWWRNPGAAPQMLTTPYDAIIWREYERPVFVVIDQQESLALRDMREGATFGCLCRTLMASAPEMDAMAAAARYLRQWLDRGWILSVGATAGNSDIDRESQAMG